VFHIENKAKDVLKILLVEDDLHSAEILLQQLAESHYTIDSAVNVKTAWQYIETYTYDLVILDIMLPDSNGIELCTNLRAAGYTVPVLLLTAKDSTSDRVMGLEAGADDYVVKPYNCQELVARIRALLRRYSDRDTLTQELTWEQLSLDLKTNIVTYNQKSLRLTQKEYGLLELFLRYPQQVFSRGALLDQVWSAAEFPSEEAVTTHIKGLRHKLKAAGMPIDPIETLYGLGYRLKPKLVEAVDLPAVQPVATTALPEKDIPKIDQVRALEIIALVTKKFIAIFPESIALLSRVAIALDQDNLEPDLRYEGYMEAHRLIGAMGSLGFSAGSAIAFEIEQMLKSDFALAQTDTAMLQQLITDLEASVCDTVCDQVKSVTPTINVSQSQSHKSQQQQCDRSKVMIVDDDPNVLQILRILLENWDLEVITLQDPQQFWQVLESTSPDLLILDLIMPDCNGIDLCQSMRTSPLWKDLPIVFLSAHSDRETIRQLFIAGADDYLSKPIVEEDLYTRILSRLERRRRSPKIFSSPIS
jgi:DNA-binding response OmpR family regulator/HPt (histidine-containing phosphotransfer) domain-containing protein